MADAENIQVLSQKEQIAFNDYLKFLFRRTSVIAYRFNVFLDQEYSRFADGMVFGDAIMEEKASKKKKKKKKSKKPVQDRIWNLKASRMNAWNIRQINKQSKLLMFLSMPSISIYSEFQQAGMQYLQSIYAIIIHLHYSKSIKIDCQ